MWEELGTEDLKFADVSQLPWQAIESSAAPVIELLGGRTAAEEHGALIQINHCR